MSEPIIELRRLSKRFRQGDQEVRALDEVTLEVARGSFVSVMGPSGSGKSTLLHLIGGLDRPAGGEIAIAGRLLSGMSDDEVTIFRRRHIGFVFQFFNLLPTLSAEENVALPLLLDGARGAEARARARAMLERVALGERRTHRPDQLSGGEMQRVAIARALVIEPLVLLADEPTGNLDSRSAEDILGLVQRSHDEAGQTVILVTHDERAAAHGDRLVTLRDGRIVGDVRQEPARGFSSARSG